MNQTCLISRLTPRTAGVEEMRVRRNEKGSAKAVDAVYTYPPTQSLYAQALGLSIARGKRNTHGVRTNG